MLARRTTASRLYVKPIYMPSTYKGSRPMTTIRIGCGLTLAVTSMTLACAQSGQIARSAAAGTPAVADSAGPQLAPPAASGEQWIGGLDYIVIIPPRSYKASDSNKVAVLVRHQYTVGIFRAMEPHLQRWMRTKPDFIEVIRKPHVHYPHARYQARIFL